MSTAEKLAAVRVALSKKVAAVDARNRAEAEAARLEQESIDRAEAEKRAAAKAESDAVEADRLAIAALEAQLKQEQLDAIRAEAEAAPEVASLWARVDVDAERLKAAPYGAANMAVRAELALRRSTGLVAPADLWSVPSPNLADVTFAGLTFRVTKTVSDNAMGAGFFDLVTLKTNGGWRPIHNIADLAPIGAEQPALRWEAP